MPIQIRIKKDNGVSVHKQIVTQIKLGIFSGNLKPGEKLPSRRELAEQLGIHVNTVTDAYQELAAPKDPAKRPRIKFREGYGFYVLSSPPPNGSSIDQLIESLLEIIHDHGFTLAEVETRLRQLLASPLSGQVLVIEPEPDLREILITEITQATGFKVVGASIEECPDPARLADTVPVATYARAAQVREKLPHDTHCLLLRVNSVEKAMNYEPLPPREAVIGVASRSAIVKQFAETLLVNMGYDSDALNLCDTRMRDWQARLLASDFALADAHAATLLPAGCRARVRVFRIIAEDSLDELRGMFAPGPTTDRA